MAERKKEEEREKEGERKKERKKKENRKRNRELHEAEKISQLSPKKKKRKGGGPKERCLSPLSLKLGRVRDQK